MGLREISVVYVCTVVEMSVLVGAIIINRMDSRENVYIDCVPNIDEHLKVKVNKTGMKKEVSKTVDEFSETMIKNEIDLSEFYRKINFTRIVYISNTEGFYDPLEGNLVVDPNRIRESLLRALLEMSATRTFQKTDSRTMVASGFERTVYDKNYWPEQINHIGYGLSQGYKDILLARYFGLEGRYTRLSELATLIEDIIGKKLMVKSFMMGDLGSIKSSLYGWQKPAKEAVLTLIKMDNLYDAVYLDDPFRKIGISFTYRDLVIELSKLAIDQAKYYYNQGRTLYEMRDASQVPAKGSTIVEDILAHVNGILQTRKKQPLLLGLKPKDIKEIAEHSEKRFEYLPSKYHLKG